MEFIVYVFTAGSDHTAHEGNPRRFKISDSPELCGWTKVHEFKAFRQQIPGTIPIFVSETGGFSLNCILLAVWPYNATVLHHNDNNINYYAS